MAAGRGRRALHSLLTPGLGYLRGARCWRRWRGSRLCGEPAFSSARAAGGVCGPAARSQVPSETRSGRRRGLRPRSPPPAAPWGEHPRCPVASPAPTAHPVAFPASRGPRSVTPRCAWPRTSAAPGSPCSASGSGAESSRPSAVVLGSPRPLPPALPHVPSSTHSEKVPRPHCRADFRAQLCGTGERPRELLPDSTPSLFSLLGAGERGGGELRRADADSRRAHFDRSSEILTVSQTFG